MDAIEKLFESNHPWLVGHKIGFLSYIVTACEQNKQQPICKDYLDRCFPILCQTLDEYLASNTYIDDLMVGFITKIREVLKDHPALQRKPICGKLQYLFPFAESFLNLAVLTGILMPRQITSPNGNSITCYDLDIGDFDDEKYKLYKLTQLPPVTLYHLTALPRKSHQVASTSLNEISELSKKSIQILESNLSNELIKCGDYQDSNKRKESILGKAQSMAYHLMNGASTEEQVLHLTESLWGGRLGINNWEALKQNNHIITELDKLRQALRNIRDPKTDTELRLSAILDISDILGHNPFWSQVENILFSRSLYWPLLVLGTEDAEPTPVAISVPIGIDVQYDGKRKAHIYPEDHDSNQGYVLTESWQENLDNALVKAIDLWRGKHGNNGFFRYIVEEASAIFNFRLADFFVRELGHIQLRDVSADSYFAMTILSRFLGKQPYLSSVATGEINTQRYREDPKTHVQEPVLDYSIKTPEGIKEKIRYVFAANNFERVVLPKDEDYEETLGIIENLITETDSKSREIGIPRQTAEVSYASFLSNLADNVQIYGWRQTQYIRCPELLLGLHEEHNQKRPLLLNSDDKRVKSVLELLRKNENYVVDLSTIEVATPRVIASALWDININKRLDIKPLDTELRPPASLSWLFIRLTTDEQDDEFWHVFCNAIGVLDCIPDNTVGAKAGTISDFLCSPDSTTAASRLVNAMNCFSPSESYPSQRAPDIVVLIGLERIEDSFEDCFNPLSRPLAITSVIDELKKNKYFRISPNASSLREWLGNTRVIILSDTWDDSISENPVVMLSRIDQDDLESLSALSVFRWGFTQNLASLMLSESRLGGKWQGAEKTRKFINLLETKGIVRTGVGLHYIPSQIREYLYEHLGESSKSWQEQAAKYHLAAGISFAPYVLNTHIPSLAFDRAFLPENIHEALYHFRRAFMHAQSSGADPIKEEAFEKLGHLLRFSSMPTWNTIRKLTEGRQQYGNRDAYEQGKNIIRKHESLFGDHPMHPVHYLWTARTGAAYLKAIPINTDTEKSYCDQLTRELSGDNGFFVKAQKACDYPAYNKEKGVNKLAVLSEYANFLNTLGAQNQDKVNELDRQIIEMMNNGEKAYGVSGEWFERIGDSEPDHNVALQSYYAGATWVPNWHQLWVKAIGTMGITSSTKLNRTVELLENYCQVLMEKKNLRNKDEAIETILRTALNKRTKDKSQLWMFDRMNHGIDLIQEIWEIDLKLPNFKI